ncbi:MAG: nucleotidyltransferase family protein [Acidobacteria bacterium]|nr:nucleotidyltransferase family protein [Acidobacteriota bacterium]
MKAYLLAGGRGERLRPFTLHTPKCLVSIDGTPLLGVWLDLFEREGVTEVLLNVSHFDDQVRAFVGARARGPSVTLVVESEPIGSARTVLEHRDFVRGEESFWIVYADNLTDMRLAPMAATHRAHDGVLTIGLFHAPDPRAAGIVELDASGRVVGFEEKPREPRGDLANAGVYLARQSVFDCIPPRSGVVDFGLHVLPRLVGRMTGHVIDGFLMDIGTPSALERANANWRVRQGHKTHA